MLAGAFHVVLLVIIEAICIVQKYERKLPKRLVFLLPYMLLLALIAVQANVQLMVPDEKHTRHQSGCSVQLQMIPNHATCQVTASRMTTFPA